MIILPEPRDILRLIRSEMMSFVEVFRGSKGEFRRSTFCLSRLRSFRFGSDTTRKYVKFSRDSYYLSNIITPRRQISAFTKILRDNYL